MEISKERNLCHESGCPDLCCKNKFFVAEKGSQALTEEEIQINFPDVIKVDFFTDMDDLMRGGLYQLGDSKKRFFMKGSCRHNIDGCKAPLKPRACRWGFQFGGKRCNNLRKIARLPIIKGIDVDGNIIYQYGAAKKVNLFNKLTEKSQRKVGV